MIAMSNLLSATDNLELYNAANIRHFMNAEQIARIATIGTESSVPLIANDEKIYFVLKNPQ